MQFTPAKPARRREPGASVRNAGATTRCAPRRSRLRQRVDRLIKENYTHVVDADLAAYFDTIPHDALMAQVEAKVIDGGVLDLIRGWLKADILKGTDRWTPTQGSPRRAESAPLARRAVISPLLANIRDKTKRTRGDHLALVIVDLNRTLRGWFGAFKQAPPTAFADVDGFIRRRLRSMLLRQKKRTHIGFGTSIHKTWPNAYFAGLGLFALQAAWATARQSR